MGCNNKELQMGIRIASWQSSRALQCWSEFEVRGGHMEMRMKGVVWSIEALPLPNSTDYTFAIIEVKPSESSLHLPPKFKLLVVALQTYMRSVFMVEELLDKLYACSRFLYLAQIDKRWWIIQDAEITGVECKTATEATHQAAQAAAAFLAELMQPLPCFRGQNINTEEGLGSCFTTAEVWNGIAQAAVDGGNVLQWCKVQVLEIYKMIPCFEFEVALQDFLRGNDVISRIGLLNDRALKVSVGLEEEIRVDCSQEGVETETSLGLGSLLPYIIRNYITTALEKNECEDDGKNIVGGVLEHVVGYLTFMPRVCEVCGSHRLLQVSCNRSCSNICEARKDICRDSLPKLTLGIDDLQRREGNVRNSPSSTEEAEKGLSSLHIRDDVEKGWSPHKGMRYTGRRM